MGAPSASYETPRCGMPLRGAQTSAVKRKKPQLTPEIARVPLPPSLSPRSSMDSATCRIHVSVRVRPLSSKERAGGGFSCVSVEDDTDIVLHEQCSPSDYLKMKRLKSKKYHFDAVFSETSSQLQVYEASAEPLLDFVLEGRNASILCYGATGAGKTHTMTGTVNDPGVMVLALRDLFRKLEEKTEGKGGYSVQLSYLEVYNETVRDLLSPGRALVLRADSNLDVTVAGLSLVKAASAQEVMSLLQTGNRNRTTEPTRCNQTSSRSHALLRIHFQYVAPSTTVDCAPLLRSGKLSLIDLAGSERALATDSRTARSLEGAKINQSLLALSSCIKAVTEGKGHIPYRNSKLTQLLKDSLGGKCRSAMIANISPVHATSSETQNTLHWADRAKEIRTKISPLRTPKSLPMECSHFSSASENVRLDAEVAELRQQVLEFNRRMTPGIGFTPRQGLRSSTFLRRRGGEEEGEAQRFSPSGGGGGWGAGRPPRPAAGRVGKESWADQVARLEGQVAVLERTLKVSEAKARSEQNEYLAALRGGVREVGDELALDEIAMQRVEFLMEEAERRVKKKGGTNGCGCGGWKEDGVREGDPGGVDDVDTCGAAPYLLRPRGKASMTTRGTPSAQRVLRDLPNCGGGLVRRSSKLQNAARTATPSLLKQVRKLRL